MVLLFTPFSGCGHASSQIAAMTLSRSPSMVSFLSSEHPMPPGPQHAERPPPPRPPLAEVLSRCLPKAAGCPVLSITHTCCGCVHLFRRYEGQGVEAPLEFG